MPKIIVTHDGVFHADDVFAVAALLLLETGAEVVRTRDEQVIKRADFVVDVGGVYDEAYDRFDHHQKGGAGERENGVPYASIGLVWKKYGASLCVSAAVAGRVEQALIVPLDANDNGVDIASARSAGVSSYTISDAIRAYTPTWLEATSGMREAFTAAVLFAKHLLGREIRRAEAVLAGQERVEAAYRSAADKRLILLDGDYSWKDILAAFPEPLYVMHPQEGIWRLYSVRDNPHAFINRKDLPESWAGLRNAEFADVTGVPDAIFCHRNRFTAGARSKEGALQLAKLALESEK